MKRPAASIVILCHNDGRYVKDLVESLRAHTQTPHELIFVDNNSQDGVYQELKRVRRTYPRPVRIIRNKKNRFFSGGNNQAIRAARGENIVLLNADTLVTPGWLEGLLACASAHPEAGMVAPYTNQAAGLQVLWPPAYRDVKELPAWAARRSRAFRGQAKAVPMLIAFCVLIPRAVLARVGFLDEAFGPGGFEDYDYCLRLRLAGYELMIAEDVYVHHFGGRGYVNLPYDELRAGNRKIYWDKWCRNAWDRHGRPGAVPAF